jgi:hypothetical protein
MAELRRLWRVWGGLRSTEVRIALSSRIAVPRNLESSAPIAQGENVKKHGVPPLDGHDWNGEWKRYYK